MAMKAAVVLGVAAVVLADEGPATETEHPYQGLEHQKMEDFYQYGEVDQSEHLHLEKLRGILRALGHNVEETSGQLSFVHDEMKVFVAFEEHNSISLRAALQSSKVVGADEVICNDWNGRSPYTKATMAENPEDEGGERPSMLLLHHDFFLYARDSDEIDKQAEHAVKTFLAEKGEFFEFVQKRYQDEGKADTEL